MRALMILVAACGGSTVVQTPKADLSKAVPVTLEADRPRDGEPRVIKVRVWADAAVRALPHWKDEITDQIDYAGQLLTPLLGVRVTVDKIADWNRTGDPKAALADLIKTDDGNGVTWVIGYVAAPDVASKAISELGDAQLLGHHVVVRAWAEKPETDALAAVLPDISQAERSELIGAHRRHKQAVVLLHLLAQTLGAIAEADPSWIQHPLYSPKQSTFSDRNRGLMQLAIDARLADTADSAIAHDLLENIEKAEWGGWIPTDHEQVVTLLRNQIDAAKLGKTAADVPAEAYAQFDRIRELEKTGKHADAQLELDNLLSAYPGNATMYELKCELLLAKPGVADPTTRAACARVAELAPGDPSPHLAVGEALARGGDLGGARRELQLAAGKIVNLPAGQPEAWRKLVAIYQAMGALTWTEDVIAAGKLDGDPAAAAVAQTRARYGVARGSKVVKPDAEGAFVAAVRDALALVNASKYGDAERALAAAEKKWPGAPGVAAARCDLALRQGQVDAARAACQRALAADPNESWALYLSGVVALRDTSASGARQGIAQLKLAITVDPDLGQAWRALAKAYLRIKDQTAYDELAGKYATKFGQALPP
jgi:predicted Zn-dependent protease